MKLDITHLSSVFLPICTTDAILALLGKVEVLILLLMAIDSSSAKMSDANLTSLVGILSIPGAFFVIQDGFEFLNITLEPQLEEGIEWNWIVNFCFYGFLQYWGDFCICLK